MEKTARIVKGRDKNDIRTHLPLDISVAKQMENVSHDQAES